MNMRHFMTLLESASDEPHFYMHVTSAKNIPSIMKNGLVPNHGGGNYDNQRWASLDGVYASKVSEQLQNYLAAHRLENDFGLFIIEVLGSDAVPDEDIIDTNLSYSFEQVINKSHVSVDDLIVEYLDSGEINIHSPFWAAVIKSFMGYAGSPAKDPWTPEQIVELVDHWFSMEYAEGSDAVMNWSEIKDKFTRAYPNMINSHTGDRHSVRIPRAVGFEGSTKIIAVYQVQDGEAEAIYNKVPPEARSKVQMVVGALAMLPEDEEEARGRLMMLATERHPNRSEKEIADAISKLHGSALFSMLRNYER
jgi:hypothetical protein